MTLSDIVNADERANQDWQTFPPRQLTGKPKAYHCYIGRKRPEMTCGRDHRSVRTAKRCGEKLARLANIQELKARE